MKKYIFLVLLFAIGFLASGKEANAQAYLSGLITLDKYTVTDTTKSLGDYTDWYLEVYNASDSTRTFTLQGITNIDNVTGVNVSMVDITAGTAMTTAVTGQQSLTTGLRKVYKIQGGTYYGFIINAEGRYTTYYYLKAVNTVKR